MLERWVSEMFHCGGPLRASAAWEASSAAMAAASVVFMVRASCSCWNATRDLAPTCDTALRRMTGRGGCQAAAVDSARPRRRRGCASAATNCRVHASQEKPSAWVGRLPGRDPARLRGERRSSSSTPVTPWTTTSTGPVTGYAATGTPQAIASSRTRPNVSVRLGKTNTSDGGDVLRQFLAVLETDEPRAGNRASSVARAGPSPTTSLVPGSSSSGSPRCPSPRRRGPGTARRDAAATGSPCVAAGTVRCRRRGSSVRGW